MRKYIAAALVSLCAATSFAQKAQVWKLEPEAVFGIPIGGALENDRISECGGVKADAEKHPIAVCAMQRPGYGGILIAGFPVPVFDNGFINREDGVVTTLVLNGKHKDYKDIKTLLVERYGKPTLSKVERLQNKMGATFTSEVLYWNGKKVGLTLHERSGTVDETSAFFTSLAHAKKTVRDREIDLKDAASKM